MIGLIINPVAGLGGTVGLKGTDDVVEKALELGAAPKAGERAVTMLQHLKTKVYTCGGEMGAEAAEKAGIDYTVVYEPSHPTTREDTVKAARMMEDTIDLLVFCGGDGTARDITAATDIPILGVPAGVKMYSACFAVTPQSAAETVHLFIDKKVGVSACEILDIDEALYRNGRLSVKVFGYADVPEYVTVQMSKHVIDSKYQKKEIATFIRELMRDDTVYIIGAGTTTQAIGDVLNVDKTLLGVDIVKGGQLIRKDCSEAQIIETLAGHKKSKIIVSPIGGQGFIFGRGNQQISYEVIKTVGAKNVIVVASPEKLAATPVLHVDTGDDHVDRTLTGEYSVVCGYRLAARKQVIA